MKSLEAPCLSRLHDYFHATRTKPASEAPTDLSEFSEIMLGYIFSILSTDKLSSFQGP
jgi:hypothetical protein